MTRSGKLLCAFLAAVIVVALYHAVGAMRVPIVDEQPGDFQRDGSAQSVEEGTAESGTLEVDAVSTVPGDARDVESLGDVIGTVEVGGGEVAVIRGEDGRDYYSVDDIIDVYGGYGTDDNPVDASDDIGGEYERDDGAGDVREEDAGIAAFDGEGRTYTLAELRKPGNDVYKDVREQGTRSVHEENQLRRSYEEGLQDSVDTARLDGRASSADVRGGDTACKDTRGAFRKGFIAYNDCLASGVYRIEGKSSDLNHRALWLGGIGVKTFSKVLTKLATSKTWKKIKAKVVEAGMVPILACMLQFAGISVTDAELAALAQEERIVYTEVSAELTNVAMECDISEIAYAASARAVYNNSAGIEMSATEFAAAVADDIVVGVETGELPTIASSTWEVGLLQIAAGGLPTEFVQPLAAYGETLMDWFGLEHPEAAHEWTYYADAPVGGTQAGSYPNETAEGKSVDSSISGYQIKYAYSYRGSPETGTTSRYTNPPFEVYAFVSVPDPDNYNMERVKFVYIYPEDYANGHIMQTGAFYVDAESYTMSTSPDLTVHLYRDVPLDVKSEWQLMEYIGYGADGGETGVVGDVLQNVIDAGNQIIGHDAEFDGDGNLVDAGTVDVNKVLDHEGSYDTWQDVIDTGDVVAVKPSNPDEGVKATDEVTRPYEKNPETGEYEKPTGKEKAGDAVRGNGDTPTRVSAKLDGKLGELEEKVSGKFPFSVPANMSTVVGKFQAQAEAPRIEWVFAVPTGEERLVIDLAEYAPVAAVLRFMLDVVLVFSLVSLLAKVAELFNLVNGE